MAGKRDKPADIITKLQQHPSQRTTPFEISPVHRCPVILPGTRPQFRVSPITHASGQKRQSSRRAESRHSLHIESNARSSDVGMGGPQTSFAGQMPDVSQ